MAGIMQTFRRKLLNQTMTIDELLQESGEFISFADRVIRGQHVKEDELENFLILCLDVYCFSNGKVLIPDRTYDECMRVWTSLGNKVIVYPDAIGQSSKWEFRRHEIPGMVGTLPKIYEYKELKEWFNYMRDSYGVSMFMLAPKYDGISVCIKIDEDGDMDYALTRYDGESGQNVVATVSRAKNARDFYQHGVRPQPGFYKCEIIVSTDQFGELIKEKPYANRRSATSGILSSPSNRDLGIYLTIVPLLFYDRKTTEYLAPYKKTYQFFNARDMMDVLEDLLVKWRKSDFFSRVDGVVIYPISDKLTIDEGNLMEHSVAFKVNTAEGRTILKSVYLSVGRLGNAIPMAKVEPVEVNETIVTDISLGSMERFNSLGLYEGEEVIIFSAGDAIPQLKKTDYANNVYDKPFLKLRKECPYCGEKLTRFGAEYKCVNSDCIRVNTGRIANFASKLGVQGFSDKTFEDFYQAGIVKSIADLFRVKEADIVKLDGYEETSAASFCNEIDKLRETKIPISEFFGALGIPGISNKKCAKIFEYVTLNDVLGDMGRKKIVNKILDADGIGMKTAEIFADFIVDHRKEIAEIVHEIRVIGDVRMKGTIVFTGFRNARWAEKFKNIGYQVSDSVTSSTVAVVSANTDWSSTKCKAALKKGISIYLYAELEDLYDKLKG